MFSAPGCGSAWPSCGNAASLGGNVEQPTPYGMYGNPTHGEVQAKSSGQSFGSHPYQRMPSTEAANANLPTPSQVIDNPQAYLARQGPDARSAKRKATPRRYRRRRR